MAGLGNIFRRKPKPGDMVYVLDMFEPSGPAQIIDKSYDPAVGATDMYPKYLCLFEDGRTEWYNIRCFEGWEWPDQK